MWVNPVNVGRNGAKTHSRARRPALHEQSSPLRLLGNLLFFSQGDNDTKPRGLRRELKEPL